MRNEIQATLDEERKNFTIKKLQLESEVTNLSHSIDNTNVRMR
jgi:hypothetical protein